jgi:hypothetical protein
MAFIRYFLVAVLFVVTGIVYSREAPKLKIWILKKVQVVSREKAQLEVKAQSIDFVLFPPGIKLNKLKVEPKDNMSQVISPTTVETLGVYLSPLSLLLGKFEIGNISIDGMITNIFIRNKMPSVGGIGETEQDSWSKFINIPVRSVSINHAEIRAKVDPADISLQLKDFSLLRK